MASPSGYKFPILNTIPLNASQGVAVDSSGNVYIADSGNHVIRKIEASSGISTIIAGTVGTSGSTGDGGAATSALLNTPYGIAVDSSNGIIYIADTSNNKIRKIKISTGIINTFAGTGTGGSTGDGGAATSALLNTPYGLGLDSSGNIYIADTFNHTIRKIDATTGIITRIAGTIGSPGSTGDGAAATSALLNYPFGVVVDSAGNFYIDDWANTKIRKVTLSTGFISTFAGSGLTGSADGVGASASFNNPSGIAIDSSGNLYIGDRINNRIRKITTSAIVTSIAGNPSNVAGYTGDGSPAWPSARLNSPNGVAVDSSGNVYFNDTGNNAIRYITVSTGIINTLLTPSSTVVDMADMFVRKELFLNAGLRSWGYNVYGQLGNGTNTDYSSPIQIGSLTNWKQVACGYYHTAAVKTDGTLWTVGSNIDTNGFFFFGQLGNNSQDYVQSSPIQVGTLTNWKQVACGAWYTSAIKTDGTLWTWGNNTHGQMGNSAPGVFTLSYSSPIQVGTLTNWKQVACGYAHTTSIKTDGTLWAWGDNYHGQLGNGTNTDYSSPIQIGTLTNWKQVACGYKHTAAIKTNGTLWAWGLNYYGQLGNGTTAYYSSPIQIGSLTNWKQVACGRNHTVTVKTDGTLWTCGYNNSGQLGNGTVDISYSSPIQVGSLTNWKQVACGYKHTTSIKTNGTLWACGYNGSGQLGNGTVNTNYSSPIQIGSLTNWKQVAGGIQHTIAITSPDLP